MPISQKQKFNLIRPLPPDWPKDERGVPHLKKADFSSVKWNKIGFASFANLAAVKKKETTILLHFQYDYTMTRIYDDVFAYARKFDGFLAVTTPDYSAYTNMEPYVVEENVSHGLWVGAWFQYLGVNVIPTVTWADERTYSFCFSHIEKGSVVAISTIGISGCEAQFIQGFKEMKRKIDPPLMLVRGKPIKGMDGNFIFIDFSETFIDKCPYEQLSLFPLDRVMTIKEGE